MSEFPQYRFFNAKGIALPSGGRRLPVVTRGPGALVRAGIDDLSYLALSVKAALSSAVAEGAIVAPGDYIVTETFSDYSQNLYRFTVREIPVRLAVV